ncbi:PRC-barrel domain-containing protein [Sulfitobacter sp. F26169L]|uniref:PRC-barrel domain-containing protein n=1 Tax=Sulfitobacter sp. F26169L TaxID=2996015 RepID=UPI002260E83C|nr:PRC-barrel domain-containing protein [Sulfitobacter sp. F26169L]MCX7566085.1 PRC-barrel domain-containing protein [Sulfitobacter sp. F26169L]
MKTRILAMTTALIAATSTFATAQSTLNPNDLISADQIADGDIYRLEVTSEDPAWISGEPYTRVEANWNKVGDISDVLLDKNGRMVAVLVEIGGFLDIGDRDVILPLDSVRFTIGEGGEYHYVTNLTEEELNNLPEVDEDIWD